MRNLLKHKAEGAESPSGQAQPTAGRIAKLGNCYNWALKADVGNVRMFEAVITMYNHRQTSV